MSYDIGGYNPWGGIARPSSPSGPSYVSDALANDREAQDDLERRIAMDDERWAEDRKRRYWQELLGENFDERLLPVMSDPQPSDKRRPMTWMPSPSGMSPADEKAYLWGASPQNAGALPTTETSYGVGKRFTGQRPGWSDNPSPVPVFQGPDPIQNMTGHPAAANYGLPVRWDRTAGDWISLGNMKNTWGW